LSVPVPPAILVALLFGGTALAQLSPVRPPESTPCVREATGPQSEAPSGTADSAASQESHQRILGIIPAFGVTNRRHPSSLTPGEKFRLFARQAFDPFQWVAAGAQAGLGQADNAMPGYGQGAAGYGKRYGAAFTDVADHEFMSEFLFPVLLKQDPRYYRLGRGTLKHRIIYSLSQEFSAKSDRGAREFNSSRILGAFAAEAVSNAYYPVGDRGCGLTMRRSGISILAGMGTELAEEFWPDIACKLFHKCQAPPGP
jgi:hypothetical protein